MDFDLEALIHVEQSFYDEGYQDGLAHGRIHGLIEGRALGREKGFEMWEELGFYQGFALMWKSCLATGKDDRTANHIKHLLDLIAQFPRVNPSASEPSELDITKLLRQIRSRYKALCANLGVRPTLRASASAEDGVDDPGDTPVEAAGAMPSKAANKVWELNSFGSSVPKDPLGF